MLTLGALSSGVNFVPRLLNSSMLSAWLSTVPHVAYRSVRNVGVPPRYSSSVVAFGSKASILPARVWTPAGVMGRVQHCALAGLPAGGSAGANGTEHFAASWGMARMLVVVCGSHCEGGHTSPR